MSFFTAIRQLLNPKVRNESAISRASFLRIASSGKGLREFCPSRRVQLGGVQVRPAGARWMGGDFGIIPSMGGKLP